jgi:hypothetical protein
VHPIFLVRSFSSGRVTPFGVCRLCAGAILTVVLVAIR